MTMSDKILWHSNAPWVPTGYGQETALFAPRVAQHYDLRISSFYGLEGAPLTWNGIKVLPGNQGTYGNEAIPYHVRNYFGGNARAGLVFTLLDVWVLDTKMCSQLNVASWCPVDHQPLQPNVRQYFAESGAIPIAMARFGQEQLADFDPLYVPHAVDPKVYRPVDRMQARQAAGFDEDDFVVGMVAANKGNPSRKHFVAALQAFAEFARDRENAKLYLHTDVEGGWSMGVDLLALIDALEIPEHKVRRPDPYAIHFHPFAAELMAAVYSGMDVLLSPSAGEGFGIPVMEAHACGVPAIVTDFSAQSEVCGAGWKVGYAKVWTGAKSWQAVPFVREIVEALEDCYTLPDKDRKALSEQARSHALQYDVDRVHREFMLPALEEVHRRLGERSAPSKLKLRSAA